MLIPPDIDECADSSICNQGDCKNFPGTYQCRCHKGYQSGPRNKCIGKFVEFSHVMHEINALVSWYRFHMWYVKNSRFQKLNWRKRRPLFNWWKFSLYDEYCWRENFRKLKILNKFGFSFVINIRIYLKDHLMLHV